MNDNTAAVIGCAIICITIVVGISAIDENLRQQRYVSAGYCQQLLPSGNGTRIIWSRECKP